MPNFRVVKINDTQAWNEKFRRNYHIKNIFSVYVFNPNEATHCCELTPSYELNFVHSDVECEIDLDEDMREEMWEEVSQGDCYCDPISYMHCSSIDRMKTIDIGEFETIEEAVEYCQGNWV